MKHLLRIAVALGLLAPGALAHGGVFRGLSGSTPPGTPPAHANPSGAGNRPGTTSTPTSTPRTRVTPYPGSGPELPFLETSWEFWWEFNQDAFLELRPTLEKRGASGLGPTFAPVDFDDKTQVILPALLRALRDPDDQVRSAAVLALARLEHPSVLTYVHHAMLQDPSLAVRTNAVVALGQTRLGRAREPLVQLLWDANAGDELRAFAAISLGVLGTPEASADLERVLASGAEGRLPYSVRVAAAYAMGLTEDSGNAPMLRSLVIANPGGEDYRLRALMVLGLGRVADRAANPILIENLKDSETQVRRSTAIALGVVAQPADSDVVKALNHAADSDPDLMVRNLADLSLGRIAARDAPDVVATLAGRLRTSPTSRKAFLALALGMSGTDAALTDLMQLFRSESAHSLRGAAAVGLALLGKKEAIPLLRNAFENTGDEALLGYLAYALGRLGDQESRETMRDLLRNRTSPHLLRWCAIGLALLGDPGLPTLLREESDQSGQLLTRASGVYALGLVGDRSAMEYLIAKQQEEGESGLVRAFATMSLGLLCDGGREPISALYVRNHNYTMTLPFVDELYYTF